MTGSPDPSALRGRGGLKWTGHDPDVLAGWVAEMDYGLAPAVADALHDAVDRADTAYFYPAAEQAVAEASTSFFSDRFSWTVRPERVFSVPDVVEGLRRAVRMLTAPGSPVVLHSPVYFPFFSMVERAGREVVEAPGKRDADGVYRLDLDAIASALEGGAGSVVLCNPWNPTGRSFSRSEIEELVDVASEREARILSDEVHAPLTLPGAEHVPAATVSPEDVITVTSASKGWNMPGLKAAQVVLTNGSDAERWADYFTLEKIGVGTFGLLANAAAYSRGRGWLDGVLDRLAHNRDLLADLVPEHLPGVSATYPEATYLLWLGFGPEWELPAERLLREARVALTEGAPFGRGGEGHARLNFATYPEILGEMVRRIGSVVASG